MSRAPRRGLWDYSVEGTQKRSLGGFSEEGLGHCRHHTVQPLAFRQGVVLVRPLGLQCRGHPEEVSGTTVSRAPRRRPRWSARSSCLVDSHSYAKRSGTEASRRPVQCRHSSSQDVESRCHVMLCQLRAPAGIKLVRRSQNSSSKSWLVGQGFFLPFSDSLQPKHGWKAHQKQRETLEKNRKLEEENPFQQKIVGRSPVQTNAASGHDV